MRSETRSIRLRARSDPGEGFRLRSAAVLRASEPPQAARRDRAALAAPQTPLQARGRRPDLRRAPGGVGAAGPPRLRRHRLQRAPHIAVGYTMSLSSGMLAVIS